MGGSSTLHHHHHLLASLNQNNSTTEVPSSGVCVGLYQADNTNQHTTQDVVPVLTSCSIMPVTLVVIAFTLKLRKPNHRALPPTCFCHLLNPFIVSAAVKNCQEGPRRSPVPPAGLTESVFTWAGIFFLLRKGFCDSRHHFSTAERKKEMGKKQNACHLVSWGLERWLGG